MHGLFSNDGSHVPPTPFFYFNDFLQRGSLPLESDSGDSPLPFQAVSPATPFSSLFCTAPFGLFTVERSSEPPFLTVVILLSASRALTRFLLCVSLKNFPGLPTGDLFGPLVWNVRAFLLYFLAAVYRAWGDVFQRGSFKFLESRPFHGGGYSPPWTRWPPPKFGEFPASSPLNPRI